jgi:ATP synthase proteolipid subunit
MILRLVHPSFLLDMGAAYGMAKAGTCIIISGISAPDLVWRNLIPIIMAGVSGIYGFDYFDHRDEHNSGFNR